MKDWLWSWINSVMNREILWLNNFASILLFNANRSRSTNLRSHYLMTLYPMEMTLQASVPINKTSINSRRRNLKPQIRSWKKNRTKRFRMDSIWIVPLSTTPARSMDQAAPAITTMTSFSKSKPTRQIKTRKNSQRQNKAAKICNNTPTIWRPKPTKRSNSRVTACYSKTSSVYFKLSSSWMTMTSLTWFPKLLTTTTKKEMNSNS